MEQHKISENRRLRRFNIQIQVFDSKSKSIFAYTENLHTEGMMLISEKKIPLGKEFDLELVHIRDNDQMIVIPLHVLCVWNKPSDSLNMYNAGFEFIDLAPQQVRDIESLIEELVVH